MKQSNWKALLVSTLVAMLPGYSMADVPFTPDSQPTGWLSTPVVSFFDVSSGSEHFYRIGFFKDTWSGNVFAHDVSPEGVVDASNGPWGGDPLLHNAATKLDLTDYNTGRIIATSGGRPFRWASMTSAEKTALGSEIILNFVRGDRSNEEPDGATLRQREFVLGDILHSNATYWDNGTSQSVFVGANDGMLHVFDATTGNERWAYVPSMLIPKLSMLAVKPYVHTHYVDGSIRVSNVTISGSQKTMLVSGLGAGGIGLFALDVTSHTAADETAAAGKLMWEIAAGGSFADLGHVYGTPQITRLQDGDLAVVVSNGYMSATGKAVLYVIDASDGSLIRAIDTGTGSAGAPNGLSSPTLYDADGNGQSELAYAGDLDGQMWKFDLISGTATLLHATSPAQSITTAPVVVQHPQGGRMVNFATGRMLTSGDKTDTSIHYAYGIWDGAPGGNNSLLAQTISISTYDDGADGFAVRTVTANEPDWTSNKGWRVALPAGERVLGERPFGNDGRFYFVANNPVAAGVTNYIYELGALTGGPPLTPIFDLNQDGDFDSDDYAENGQIPISKYLGNGIFSQPRLIEGDDLTTTLYVFHPDLPIEDGVPTPPDDPGVSGGHFDYDIYYYSDVTTVTEPTAEFYTPKPVVCAATSAVDAEHESISSYCQASAAGAAGYTYLTEFTSGLIACASSGSGKGKDPIVNHFQQTLTCNSTDSVTYFSGDYKKVKHVHEYDDIYDVTGVNMLNASDPSFNLINAIPDTTTPFKVLLMNQYLNPAVSISVGEPTFVDAKDYGNQATETDPAALLSSMPVYTRGTLGSLIFNLPLDAFKNKDWWGDGGVTRAGLIPTQTGCVNKVGTDGSMPDADGGGGGKKGGGGGSGGGGKFGERFNGSFTIQIIRSNTPSTALELNGPDVRYGWRVKAADFTDYVLAEYTAFWHHPNGFCYDDAAWIPDPAEDFEGNATAKEPAAGSADPRGGTFGIGLAIVNQEVIVSNGGLTTTTIITYNDGSTHTRTETQNDDGSTTIHQIFRDGTEETVTITEGRGGDPGYVDPNTGSPIEGGRDDGRQSWRELE